MAVDVRILAAVFIIYAAPFIQAQDHRCSYMIAIPREPKPDNLPEENFDGLSWSQRPLVPAPERDDLCMDMYVPIDASSAIQVIYVDEEREGDIAIAKLNYDGDNQPYIEPSFSSGTFVNLGPAIRKGEDGAWYLYTTVRQDYEAGMTQYLFQVGVPGETLVVSVSLLIVNIDDNQPMMQIFEACQVPELEDAHLTECVYEVTDADGQISTGFMTFLIESERGDDQIFYIHGTNIPGTWFTMRMTVGIREPLNFEENPLHIFSVTAMDSLPNNHTVTMMVQVQNVEHRPPRWVEIFAVQQFDEKTRQNFTVRAIDGDTGIDKPIYYRLETDPADTFFRIETIPGGRSGAIFYVDEIDRDTLEREVFQLSIIAYKYDNESFATAAPVVIIVNDVNDNKPVPFHDEYRIEILEETAMTLDLEDFGFHDRDLGQNAQYTVHLEAVDPPGTEAPFYIAPTVGYQRQTFIMGTSNHSMLDYEVPEFQHITMRVVAIDMNNTEFVGVATLYIDLINWNDELPIFDVDTRTVYFNETEGAGFHVATVLAEDRDIDDVVVHSLMGNVADFLYINETSGDIYVSANDSFDYHRQNVIFVQVRADDTLGPPYHTATSQLVIHLLDINNTPPTLRLPRGSPQVDENEPDGFVITEDNMVITATDPDTTAHLVFEIDWEDSYATKQGRETDPLEYHNCVEIVTSYPDENHLGSAVGHLVVREIRPNVTIDFEMFEVLYLTVRVRDIMTVIGDDSDESTFTITIIDRNDNPPVWDEGTLEQDFMVREMSNSGVVIGSILATDIDGPLYNQVRYSIFPREDTPDELVEINFYSGQIIVLRNQAIDADTPPRHNLYYTVLASDRCYADDEADCPPDPHYHDTYGEIEIFITDINNKVPQPEYDNFNTTVYIYENATNGDEVSYVIATDADRDEIYHTVRYQISYNINPRLLDFFKVDLDSGLVYVDYTTTEVLDRDGDEPTHRIFFNLIDNFYMDGDGNRNQNNTEILVVLLDVNDNAPELPDPSDLSWSISENLLADTSIVPVIHAPDRDEPGTDNSLVGFDVLNLTAVNRDIDVPGLFTIRSIDTDRGELVSTTDLRGYWGTYDIYIHAFDHGHPQQHSYETYELVVRPYNYHAPQFVFPRDGTVVRLARERAMQVNSILATVDGEFLRRIEATDEDGLEAGRVTFTISGDDEAAQYFEVANDAANDDNLGTLILRRTFTENIREFQITIRATDGGTEPGPLWSESSFRAVFVPTTGDPVFVEPTASVAFIELDAGLLERHQLPLAEDPKNHLCADDCHDIYYRIVEGNTEGHFGLDAVTNVIYLVKELDRSVSAEHTVVVAASNSPEGNIPLAPALLTVTVNVREADPRPVFLSQLYTAGISTLDTINRELLTVQARHTEGSPITYGIVEGSMVADPTLDTVRDSAFALHPQTGVLTLTMQPTASMHGMFEFKVVATDAAGGKDTADVRVFLISTLNRVTFVFVNTLQKVEESVDFIGDTFSAGFEMTCNIDQVVPASDASGLALENSTEVRAHFVRDNQPVLAEEIEQLRSDTVRLNEIQNVLRTDLLVLSDFFTGSSPELGTDPSQLTIYVLAALAALLALMCLVLLLTFIIRTRALNRRLEALSMTKYGSVASGLNRAGLAAPGTNKHAVEGSNPIWNEVIKAPDFDAISDASDDSDLIGIEDLPQFRDDYFPPGDTDSAQDILTNDPRQNQNPVANHSNNFGFNTTPFSPEFANSRFGRP